LVKAARPDETPDDTLDRNWNELLQELRVVQTGVQLLTGFLLTLPFQQRFTTLDITDRRVYLATVASSSVATLLLVMPVPLHRVLFRQHERATMVATAHWCALLGSMLLGLSLIGVNTLVFDVVAGRSVATGVAAVVAGLVLALWVTMPLVIRFVVRSRSV
jgi:hypothetical protein